MTREKREVRRRRVERDPGRRQGGQLSDIMGKIPNSACYSKRDVYVTFEGRVLRRSDEVKACGMSDGSTLQVVSKIRGGRKAQGQDEQRGEEASRGASLRATGVWRFGSAASTA